MANPDNPHGFGPLNRSLAGGPGAANFECHKLAATAAVFIGDAVVRVAAPTRKTPAIGPATAAGPVFGVNLVFGAATTATDKHLVIPSGNLQMFEVQDNDDVTGIPVGGITKNANFTTATPGSAATQLSGTELDIATLAATATLGMRLHGLLNVPSNDFGPHARVIITFQRNEEADQSAGVLGVEEEEALMAPSGAHRGKQKEESGEEETVHNAAVRGRK